MSSLLSSWRFSAVFFKNSISLLFFSIILNSNP
nr:MAG TPA: hypothetical protein [Caudoviricetes sp.]